MRREDIRDLTRAVPFRPFRMTLTNGEVIDVGHPENVIPSLGAVYVEPMSIATKPENTREAVLISLVHILKIEYLMPKK